MPVESCRTDGKPGQRWGKSGKCYSYTAGNEASLKRAKKLAEKQGAAIRASGFKEEAEMQSLVIESVHLNDGEDLDTFQHELRRALNSVIESRFPGHSVWWWPRGIFEDFVVASIHLDNDAGSQSFLERFDYERSDEGFTFGEPTRVKMKVNVNFEPVSESVATENVAVLRNEISRVERNALTTKAGVTQRVDLERRADAVLRGCSEDAIEGDFSLRTLRGALNSLRSGQDYQLWHFESDLPSR